MRRAGRAARGLEAPHQRYGSIQEERQHRGIYDTKEAWKMNYCSDPTANQAIGHLTKEWNYLSIIADRIREDPYSEWADQQRLHFTGIFRRLLDDSTESFRSKAS